LELDLEEVVYNWNTNGAGYILGSESDQVFALNRTGALPVTYLTDQSGNVELIFALPFYGHEQVRNRGFGLFEFGKANVVRRHFRYLPAAAVLNSYEF
jgi:hypothetical protein